MRRQTNIFSRFNLTTHQIFKGASLRVAENVLTLGFSHLSLKNDHHMINQKEMKLVMCVGFLCLWHSIAIHKCESLKMQRADRKNKTSLEIWARRSIDALDHKNEEHEGPRILN